MTPLLLSPSSPRLASSGGLPVSLIMSSSDIPREMYIRRASLTRDITELKAAK